MKATIAFYFIIATFYGGSTAVSQIESASVDVELALIDYFNHCEEVNKQYACRMVGEMHRTDPTRPHVNTSREAEYVFARSLMDDARLICFSTVDFARSIPHSWFEHLEVKGRHMMFHELLGNSSLVKATPFEIDAKEQQAGGRLYYFHPMFLPIELQHERDAGHLGTDKYYDRVFGPASLIEGKRLKNGNLCGKWQIRERSIMEIEFDRKSGNMPSIAVWKFKQPNHSWKSLQTNVTLWHQVNKVWLPKGIELVSDAGSTNSTKLMEFHWLIGEKVNAEWFNSKDGRWRLPVVKAIRDNEKL